MKKLRYKLRIFSIRAGSWEYWNSAFVYLPILPYLAWLWLKARNIFFFNAANPGIEYGGFLMESKWKIHTNAPDGFFPHTILVDPSQQFRKVPLLMPVAITFPLVAKPDIGSKGRGVSVINDLEQLRVYHERITVPYLIQEKINYLNEAGIFYVRLPGESSGKITGIVQKEYIKVTGNGKSSLKDLLKTVPRYFLQLTSLERLLGNDAMAAILPLGQTQTLIEIGNHARGATFINASDRITQTLNATIDKICKQLNGFYFGRLDIRFKDWESLENGAHFAVIEVNGAGSEPTHIYDPSFTILDAWKEICRHWKIMYEISTSNHKNGTAYLNWKEAVTMFRNNSILNQKLALFSNK